ncbi:exonuclease domain-containing protein [uncultured Tateyamaria sp.]|uniref:exonuclease domain-containing protein n=1 Tax=uncultured Tateyamaria sp. TaxID=455651 RepID=UPI00260472CC|nr:exonuclease domain-containing protein [uncultured Tateyamaria sp.]
MAFVFFDTETTGLHKGFDQIVHFAAIKTDENLSEIERFEIRSRLNPNVVPHPEALAVNGLPIEQLISKEQPSHYEMMRNVEAKLYSWSPSIFLGYNSIKFDEEMLRYALFQTLHPAYLTSFHNNGRNDVLSLALAAYAIAQDAIAVSLRDDGSPIFRLAELAAANGISVSNAHDAMSDAETTLILCRRIMQQCPELWQRFVRFSSKTAVSEFISTEEGFLLTEIYKNRAYHTPVAFIGEDPNPGNGRLCIDLRLNFDELASLTAQELHAFLSRKPCPIRKIQTNTGPTITPLWEAEEGLLGDLGIDALEDRASTIADDDELKHRLVEVYSNSREPFAEPTHIEEKLHGIWLSDADTARARQFHKTPWPDRYEIIQTMEDDRLREFGTRIIFFEARSCLPKEVVDRLDRETAERLAHPDDKPMSLNRCLDEIRKLEEARNGDQPMPDILDGFREYVVSRKTRVSTFLNG